MLNLGLIDTPWIPAYRQAGRIEIFHTLHFVRREKSPVCRQAGFREIINSFISGDFSTFALIPK